MTIDLIDMGVAALRVLVLGVLLGAGLPALFALGMRLQSAGAGSDDGIAPRRPALVAAGWALFAVVVLVVLAGVLFITRHSIQHYFGISVFGA